MHAQFVLKPSRLLTAVFLLAALLCLAGCGAAGKVTGKVTYKGKPVPGGKVSFYGANNWTGTSSLEEDGSYTIAKVPAGPVNITVDTSSYKPVNLPMKAPNVPNMKDMSKMPKPPDMPEQAKNNPLYNPQLRADREKRYVEIPKKYADPKQSDLTYDVKSGSQTHDIDLK